jgi:hypothetical protein
MATIFKQILDGYAVPNREQQALFIDSGSQVSGTSLKS